MESDKSAISAQDNSPNQALELLHQFLELFSDEELIRFKRRSEMGKNLRLATLFEIEIREREKQ